MSFVQRTTEGREQACKNLWGRVFQAQGAASCSAQTSRVAGGGGQVTEGETGGWGKRAGQGANIPPEPGLHSK